MASVARLQRHLVYESGPLNLMDRDSRRLLHSGPVGSKKLNIFLLTDLIILAKGPHPSTGQYKAVGPKIDMTDKSFTIRVCPTDRTVLSLGTRDVHFKSNEELRVWHSRISEALLNVLASSVFGSPLGSGRNGKDIPPLVLQTIRYLANPQILSLKGIFRLSGAKAEIDRLKAAVDKGQDAKLNDPNVAPHDVSTMLKQFFRELPQPLIPFALYTPLMSLYEECAESDLPRFIAQLSTIFADTKVVPSCHYNTLRFLLEFLRNVAEYSPINLMTPHNIAIVFAPNIFHPLVETMQTSLAQPTANAIIEILLTHYHEVFTTPFQSPVPFPPPPPELIPPSS